MISIHYQHFSPELRWIINVVFKEFLGLEYALITDMNCNLEYLSIHLPNKKVCTISNVFLGHKKDWLSKESLPQIPLKNWLVADKELEKVLITNTLPVLYGNSYVSVTNEEKVQIEIDLFGTCFFMLSGYEERVVQERNKHDNFVSTYSILRKEDFIERPIVDEYVEVLWHFLYHLDSSLIRKSTTHKMYVSCDVDRPYQCPTSGFINTIRPFAGDLIRRKSLSTFWKRFKGKYLNTPIDHKKDPNYIFDWYMNTCERLDLRAAFYFICGNTAGAIDGCYDIGSPFMRELLQEIDSRGHEIGLHPSYNTYQSFENLRYEYDNLSSVLKDMGLDNKVVGGRQHYLRWDIQQTPDYLDRLGLVYDTTGGFSDHVGFKYGTSREFTMWSWKKQDTLQIKQRPLIVMEVSVFSESYMGLSWEEGQAKIRKIKRRALKYGNFTFLWHNSELQSPYERKVFNSLLER